ncbi:MAG TPA: SMP-30/gluconolactonase/LRE family protein [Polyangiales bacterium]|nr:SMP-30/gluconolactonase/LRE family protein [Polyangiales bacterium]
MKRIGTVGLVLCLACGDDGETPSEDAARPGAPDASAPDAGRLDASADARTPDARAPVDAARAPVDAATPDAGTDAAAPGLRATICGDATDWPNPLPASRTAQRVSDGFGFVEGPVWVAELGVLLFSDMNMGGSNALGPPSQIRRLTPPSSFDVLQPVSGSNGLALFAPTTLLAATHETRSLAFVDARTGLRTPIAITYDNKRFNSPNDIAIRDDGWVYFSDPDYQRGARAKELDTAIYRVQLSASTSTASAQLIEKYTQPNGVALSPDQKTLYVGSSGNDIFKYDVAADGSVSNKTPFAKVGGSDGLAVDCAGNLYVTSGTVEVFAPAGDKLGDINVGVGDNPSNVAFGGASAKTLYITAGDSLYAIELKVPGFPY